MALYEQFSLVKSIQISSSWERRGLGIYVPIVKAYFVYEDDEVLWYQHEYTAVDSPLLADEVAQFYAKLDGERITRWTNRALENILLN